MDQPGDREEQKYQCVYKKVFPSSFPCEVYRRGWKKTSPSVFARDPRAEKAPDIPACPDIRKYIDSARYTPVKISIEFVDEKAIASGITETIPAARRE